MTFFPGDIIIVKDLEFKKGVTDETSLGRPCLFLYGNNDTLTVFPFTSKIYKYQEYGNYSFYDFGDRLSMVELSHPLTIKSDQVIYISRNASKDFFRIIYQFQKLYADTTSMELKKCWIKLSIYTDMEHILKPILAERCTNLRRRSKILLKEEISNDEDIIQKKLTKQKVALYKKNKQFDSAYSE